MKPFYRFGLRLCQQMLPTVVCMFLAGAQSEQTPPIVSFDPEALSVARTAWQSHDPAWRPVFNRLRKDADAALRVVPHSVVEKSQTPVSGDKHDYMSMARYYWPDTTKPGGLPYRSRDGVVNPEINSITDLANSGRMIAAVHTLSLAYAVFGDESYAAHAARHMKVWFLDSATLMNPHMSYAQGVKGLDDGRPAGILEIRDIGYVCDASTLLASSPSWPAADQLRLRTWFRQYFDWLMTHKNARAAAVMANNHSVWFAVQAGSIALFAGEDSTAQRIFERCKRAIIDKQIEPDGSQPLELARTISAHYVFFNLEAFFRLATVAQRAGVDLWHYRSQEGRSLRGALDWTLPYLTGTREWTWKQIKKFDWADYYSLLVQAASVYGDPKYRDIARNIAPRKQGSDPIHLFAGP